MNKDIHKIQADILKALLLREAGRFSEIKPADLPSDQFTFHLKKLTESGVVEKTTDGFYRLTIAGKDYANRYDIDSKEVKLEKQAKLGVLIIASRGNVGNREYVMQTRLKQPFFGFRGFVTGKIKAGESVIETAARELEEETGLRGKVRQKCIYHERIYSSAQELLEDKYFFICLSHAPEGNLITDFEGGKNEWLDASEALKGNIFYDIADLLLLAEENAPAFSEKSYTVEKY